MATLMDPIAHLLKTWGYKSTDAKIDRIATLLLAQAGFLCRSAYIDEIGRRVANVARVQFGDHLQWWHYDRPGKRYRPCGAFVWEIVRADEHPLEAFVDGVVDGTCLYRIKDPSFLKQFDPEGAYQPDPHEKAITGWLIRPTTLRMPGWARQVPTRGSLLELS